MLDGGQPLSEASLLTARGLAAPPGLAPGQQDLPVADKHVAGCRPGMLLDPRGRLAAPGAAARRFRRGVGDHLDQGLPVLGLRHRPDQQPGDPQQDRRRGAARRAGRRGLRGHGGAGSVQRRRFLLRISVSWSKRESLGNRLLSSSSRNSQTNPWICGRGRAQFTGHRSRGNGKPGKNRAAHPPRNKQQGGGSGKRAPGSGIQRRAAWRSLAPRKGRNEPCRGRSREGDQELGGGQGAVADGQVGSRRTARKGRIDGTPVKHWNDPGAARKGTRCFPEPMVSGDAAFLALRTLRKANER